MGVSFLDFDIEIVRREGMPITAIFAMKGEPSFRAMERALTEEVARIARQLVLAPGGGWVSQPDVVAVLRPHARIVYLQLSPGDAVRRMGPRMSTRPLLQKADPRGELERLLALRRDVYESADITIAVEKLSPQRVAECIERRMAESFK